MEVVKVHVRQKQWIRRKDRMMVGKKFVKDSVDDPRMPRPSYHGWRTHKEGHISHKKGFALHPQLPSEALKSEDNPFKVTYMIVSKLSNKLLATKTSIFDSREK